MKKNQLPGLAGDIIQLIGGKSNISFFTHCMTRLRFNLKDHSLVRKEDIENLTGVLGCQWQGNQLQIVIGQSVSDVYSEICNIADINQKSTLEESTPEPRKKFTLATIFDAISGCIAPIIPVLVGAGMIKVVVLLGELIGILHQGMPTHTILTFVGDAGFYFLPILVGGSAAKKFGANQYLGMLMGCILVYPNLVTMMGEGKALSLVGLPVYATFYPYSIFTSIVVVYVMSHVERFVARVSHDSVRSITEPLITILVMVPLSLCLLAPLGAFIGQYFTEGILWLYHFTGFFSVMLLAALIPFVIMTGMHSAFDPYLIQAIARFGHEPIGGVVFFINNFNQGAAAAAVALHTKDVKMKSIAASSAVTAIIGGVCEPAMYGVNLKLKTPMYGSIIGSAVAGAYVGLSHVVIYAYPGNAALFGMLTFVGPDKLNFINFVIGIVLGMTITFISTLILLKRSQPFSFTLSPLALKTK